MRKLGKLSSFILAWIWSFFPWTCNKLMAHAFAFLWLDILGIRKKIIRDNLEIVFPKEDAGFYDRTARKSMFALCRSFFDVIRIPYLNNDWIEKNVIFDGKENIDKIKNSNEGFFFLSLHLGSGDLAGAIVSEKIYPITIISKRFHNRFIDAFWFGLRERSKTKFINAHAKNNAFDILASLKDKRAVVFVLDQYMGKPFGIETDFFGVSTGTAYGLALFAKKTKKPIYPLYTYWDQNDKLHVCIDDAIDLNTELGEDYKVITDKLNKTLEKIIFKHPEHWMWVHRRWKVFE